MSNTDKNPAAVRVCAIADIQCSRDCGTGPCKREREARYPSTYNSRADALTERDPSKTSAEQGLFRKFDVRRTDGSDAPGGKHHDCEYFVLDMNHDGYARAALRAYTRACAAEFPVLAADLNARYTLEAVEQHEAAPAEEMIRFCPECGRLGDIPAGYEACCPDWSHARIVPKRFAELCAETFRLCVNQPYPAAQPATSAPLEGTGNRAAFIDIVFDGPPSHQSGRFVEVEDEQGRSFNAGQWIDRGNGLWALRIARAPRTEVAGAVPRSVIFSLECTANWLEGGCDPKAAAHEIRLNLEKLRAPSADAAAAPADERADCITWANANGFTKYHESMCAAWEERGRRAAASQPAAGQRVQATGMFVKRSMFGPWIEVDKPEPGAVRLYTAPPAQVASQIDVEAMLRACVPGGDIVDPQLVCDNIRQWFAEYGAQVATRQGLTDERIEAMANA